MGVLYKSSERLICRAAAHSCFCIITDFGHETNYALANTKKSCTLIVMRYQPQSHGFSQLCVYIIIHRYKNNDEDRYWMSVPSNALIDLTKFFFENLLSTLFKLNYRKLKSEILEHWFIPTNIQIMYALLNK